MTRAFIALCFYFAVSSLSLAGDLDRAIDVYETGDYDTAYELFLPLAEQGDVTAQSYVGDMHFSGHGVSQDRAVAVEWYEKAALMGHVESQFKLGNIYRRGDLGEPDHSEALPWYWMAWQSGHQASGLAVAEIYDFGLKDVPLDKVRAHNYYTALSEDGYAPAQVRLSMKYFHGWDGIEKDVEVGYYWIYHAIDQNNAFAQRRLALLYLNDAAIPRDEPLGISLLELAAQNDDRVSQFIFAEYLEEGKLLDRDLAEAAGWYERAAKLGDARSQAAIARFYETGQGGLTQNTSVAADWYLKAAEQGNTDGEFGYAWLRLTGNGVERDWDEAAEWMLKAAKWFDKRAMTCLGVMHMFGMGVEWNPAIALQYLSFGAIGFAVEAFYSIADYLSDDD